MSTIIKMKPSFESLADVGRYALEEAGNPLEAVGLVKSIILNDQELYHKLIDPMVDSAIERVIRGLIGSMRAALKYPPNPDRTIEDDGLKHLAWTLMENYWLHGMKVCLGDATAADLKDQEEIHKHHELGNRLSRRFCRLIREELEKRGKACVREGFKEAELQEFRIEAGFPKE